MSGDRYTHGHGEAVLRSHKWRTAENSAAHLLPLLRPGDHVLDVGCGPGTITVDLARRVPDGSVVGIDAAEVVVAEAERARVEAGVANARFAVGDVYCLGEPDGTYDVVHAHQVLQHLSDPVRALAEMRRVLRPGGLLAVRDSDYGAFVWWPLDPRLDRWLELYHQITHRNGAEADAGRRLLAWVRAAGFAEAVASSSTWTFADPEARAWWGGLWADRVAGPTFRDQALEYGFSDPVELSDLEAAWRAWAAAPDGVFVVLHAEVVARRPV